MKHNFTKDLKFRIREFTQKIFYGFYTNTKDPISKLVEFYVAYQLNGPGLNHSNIDKAEHNVRSKTEEHAWIWKEFAIENCFKNCTCYNCIENLFLFNSDWFDKTLFYISTVQSNSKAIDSVHNWKMFVIKETLLIKQKIPKTK